MIFGLALLAMQLLPAPSALASGSCPNEAVRAESNINPTTHEAYDMGLPECRAYEMVSPLEKQGHDAKSGPDGGPLVSPDGEAVGYYSEGAFAEPENFRVDGLRPQITYIGRLSGSRWATEPAIVPASVISEPITEGFEGDASLNLGSLATCGGTELDASEGSSKSACAMRSSGEAWSKSPDITAFTGAIGIPTFWGSSSDLSDVVWQKSEVLPGEEEPGGGIFETTGLGTPSPQVRAISVNNEGTPLRSANGGAPYFGAARRGYSIEGSVYQAISADGQTVFFEAEPTSGGPLTLFARTGDFAGGTPTLPTTVEIASAGTFVGASADGSKVFFVTAQTLAARDHDSTSDLYEYSFDAPAGQHYIDVSAGGLGDPSPGSGADVSAGLFEDGSVQGSVVAISPDGSHVFFSASAELTTLPNGNGEHAGPSGGTFCYDTETGETKFVASSIENTGAQTTPSGRYLIFTTTAHLSPEDTNAGRAVYRYDFQTGEVTWVSHAAPGFAILDEGDNATLAPREEVSNGRDGAMAYYADARRAISDDGASIIFTTAERLQAEDVSGAPQVYLWHDGRVSLISDGTNPAGVTEPPSMSGTGSDIVFATTTQLVRQDTDHLQDIYDARVDGGFPAPEAEPSCKQEGCQGGLSSPPAFGTPGSETFSSGGNQTAPPFRGVVLEPEPKPKSTALTDAWKLEKALAKCKRHLRHAKRASCERAARRRYEKSPNGRVKAK